MPANGTVLVAASVVVDDHCPIACEVVGDQAQFTLGHDDGRELFLAVSEHGLEALVDVATAALAQIRAAG
ncbi:MULTISPECIES: hypothetical protein [Actinosynnema]|uniref:hypothetical protein n=1 Tax=Actinosynnema TaxID=40566 RepID=UPI0020A37CCA|nr:hypothetical protein [Actinosynnema pretiosum]MCP2095143.1 hypothetical protein [Actinosynnema pretiosum]